MFRVLYTNNPARSDPRRAFLFRRPRSVGSLGGTAGYNLQRGNFVFGVEADIGYMNLNGSGIIPSSTPPNHRDATLDGGLYGDVTGRLGYAFDCTLVYAKGGSAFYDGEGKQVTTKPGYTRLGALKANICILISVREAPL
jgi:hypothetical protein